MNDFDVERRYPALSVIVLVIKIIAVLVALIGGLQAFYALQQVGVDVVSIGITLGVVVAFVIMWAVAESIAVVIDIEANTRATAIAMRKPPKDPLLERLGHEPLPPMYTR